MTQIMPGRGISVLDPSFFKNLSESEWLIVQHLHELWLRPEQRLPKHDWRTFGIIAGRGWGKSHALAVEINHRVEKGEAHAVALMGPNAKRTEEVQIQFLLELAPPWFRPERYAKGLRWPNGVQALTFTPEAPERSRSGNFDLTWCCELVDWQTDRREEAWNNIATATRVGKAQILWDTTSKGKNSLILKRELANVSDPDIDIIQRGTTFDNPLLSRKYIAAVCAQYAHGGRRYEEEILGKVFAESAGAAWQQAWLDQNRRLVAPTNPELVIVGVDPALSDHVDADATGIIVGARGQDGHVYLLEDLTGKHKPNAWGDIVVQQCATRAAGVILERNRAGDYLLELIRSRALTRGLTVEELTKDRPFPARRPGVIYVREVVSYSNKSTRAEGPASETQAGRVHIVGYLDALELEFTTYEQGDRKSPNRYDAAVFVISELRNLGRDLPKSTARDDMRVGELAHAELRAGLRRLGGGRRVGL
jgi:phage terminase large subunit-like protein